MKKICLCFQIHQPFRLRRYRFFDIGKEHHYYDDFQNGEIFQRIADSCYLPANRMLLELLRTYPDFRVSFSISGLAIEQMETYKPELLNSFQELVATGRVELLATPYAHSLSSLIDHVEFKAQIEAQQSKLRELFGVSPSKVLCNTELIYSDDIARVGREMGFEAILTEGAKHVLGWKSPNYLYSSSVVPEMKLLLRNPATTEIITRDFCRYDSPEYPVTAEKILERIKWQQEGEDLINLYMNYEVLGVMHPAQSGIFDFFRALPALSPQYEIGFALPSELAKQHKPVGALAVAYPISCVGEEKSTNDWTGNILQQGALEKLRTWSERVHIIRDNPLLQDWLYLQSADHFYYMNTHASTGFSPYTSAYDAFNNYMNVLSDFLLRVEESAPTDYATEVLNSYEQTIHNQEQRIKELEATLHQLQRGQGETAAPLTHSAVEDESTNAVAKPPTKRQSSKTGAAASLKKSKS